MEERLDFKVHNKWQEAIYQVRKMLKSFKDYQNSTDGNQSKLLQEFRYDFNAFVNASRSVTFVLQNVYNKIPEFETWYASKQEILKQNDFARTVLNLRNLNQKTGNTYPMIEMTYSENNKIETSIVFSGVPIRLTENFTSSFRESTSTKIAKEERILVAVEKQENETIDELWEKHKDEVIKKYVENEIRLRKEIEAEGKQTTILSKKVVLGEQFTLDYEEFKEQCFQNLQLLSSICSEAYDLFVEKLKATIVRSEE